MLIKVADAKYKNVDLIESVEGFYATLAIKITFKDGFVHVLYVNEAKLDVYAARQALKPNGWTREAMFNAEVSSVVRFLQTGERPHFRGLDTIRSL